MSSYETNAQRTFRSAKTQNSATDEKYEAHSKTGVVKTVDNNCIILQTFIYRQQLTPSYFRTQTSLDC